MSKIIYIYLIILFICICDVKGKPLNVSCPSQFDLFQKHCFHLSKGRGSRRDAGSYCKKMGGYQTWIDGDMKEDIVENYLKANFAKLYHQTPFVWLPKIIPHGETFMWQDSGTNATVYLNKHGYNRSRFLTKAGLLSLYMNVFGYTFHCFNKCWNLPAFCEVNPSNSTYIKPSDKESSALRPRHNASLDCPVGFDSFKKHCFYISSGRGLHRFAEKVCERIGGYQPMINGRNKEIVVRSYLRAYMKRINYHRPYVWLPRIVNKGHSVTWKDSGKDASPFVRRYRLNPYRLKSDRNTYLMISTSGHVHHCSHCHKIQAFCETDNLSKTGLKSKHDKKEKKRKHHTRQKEKGKKHIRNDTMKNKQQKRIEILKNDTGETLNGKENHLNETTKKEAKSSHHKKAHHSGVKCPGGFDLYRRHCFFIGRRKQSIRNAKATCKNAGGLQVDIAGPMKERTVLRYLKANRNRMLDPYPFLWLSTVVGDGNYLTWLDSGKNAKYFLKKRKFYRRKFHTERYFEKEIYMYPSGGIGTCLGECKRSFFQPFCEAKMVAKNGTASKSRSH